MEQFKGLSKTVAALRQNFDTYFERYENDESLILACFLDPNNKLRYWPNVDENSQFSLNSIKQNLFEAYSKYEPLEEVPDDVDPCTEDAPQDSNDIVLQRDLCIFDWVESNFPATQSSDPAINSKLPHLTSQEMVDIEIKNYLDSEIPVAPANNFQFHFRWQKEEAQKG